jgi:hypothetical protein
MPKKAPMQKQPGNGPVPAEKPTPKQALAEALWQLGPNASPAALARFVKRRCGLAVNFCLVFPKAVSVSKPQRPARCA